MMFNSAEGGRTWMYEVELLPALGRSLGFYFLGVCFFNFGAVVAPFVRALAAQKSSKLLISSDYWLWLSLSLAQDLALLLTSS
jgi:hypothetical protein